MTESNGLYVCMSNPLTVTRKFSHGVYYLGICESQWVLVVINSGAVIYRISRIIDKLNIRRFAQITLLAEF